MNTFLIELRKEKRTGVVAVLLSVGILGAAYAFLNYIVRKDALLSLSLPPMDILLTQLYGMILVLNMFGIIVAACLIYNIEFKGNAIKKMYMLPISTVSMYLSKFIIVSITLILAIALQNLALVRIGLTNLRPGTFNMNILIKFALYSYITAMPVVSFMIWIASRCSNIWVTLGIGVAGFLSGMALANISSRLLLVHPFIIMLKPAMAMSAKPDSTIVMASIIETILFLIIGIWMAKNRRYE